jgi:uncharacterized protein (DUF488 family)
LRGRRTTGRPLVDTVGHGARSLGAFVELLHSAGIRRLIDVRTAPGSRRHPHFGRDALSASLPENGVAYEWWGRELGGFRRPRPDSPHSALRVEAFRGYADHMETPEFADALQRLVAASAEEPTALMCAESVWWRCHRRMIADALDVAGCDVLHVMDGGRLEPHRRSDALRVVDGRLVYDVRTGQGSFDETFSLSDGAGATRRRPPRTPRAER